MLCVFGFAQYRPLVTASSLNSPIGIGTNSPSSMLEISGNLPYLTLTNSTPSDGSYGRKSQLIFNGTQSGGEVSTLACIQASHFGTADDQQVSLDFRINDGNDNFAPSITPLRLLYNGSMVWISGSGSTASFYPGSIKLSADEFNDIYMDGTDTQLTSIGSISIGDVAQENAGNLFKIDCNAGDFNFTGGPLYWNSSSSYAQFDADDIYFGDLDVWGLTLSPDYSVLQANRTINIGDIEGTNNETILEVNSFSGKINLLNALIGIGTESPATLMELNSTAPYMTIHNSTHEDSNNGRESKIIFKGEQSGGENSTLGTIQFSHYENADDQKGQMTIFVNTGTDNVSPTEMFNITASALSIGSPDEWGITSSQSDMYLQAESSIYIGDIEGVANETILEVNSNLSKFVFSNGDVGIGLSSPLSALDVAGGIKMSNDSDASTADKAGTLRYRVSGNNSYLDMCMQTGASTYTWVNIKTNSW